MPFPKSIREEALVKSRRSCCVCHTFGGRNIEVHHIIQKAQGGLNTLDNAIALCFICHAEAGHYNPNHPKGTKYSPSELRRHRDEWWGYCESHPEEISITYKKESTSQEVHKYRLITTYTNTHDKVHEGYRVEFLFPVKIPLDAPDFVIEKNVAEDKLLYNKVWLESSQRIFSGQTIEVVGREIHYIEYEMNDNLYNAFTEAKHPWKLIWRFYTPESPALIGELSWDELENF
jgi:hypothetical protein